MRFKFEFSLFSLFLFSITTLSQDNIIRSSDFSDPNQWNLILDGATCIGSVSGGRYIIQITDPGSEPRSIQFTQNKIPLQYDKTYSFSFDAASSKVRTIETAVTGDGGTYDSYSVRDTVTLDSTWQSFKNVFTMKTAGDSIAMVEFNCGAHAGNVTIRNVLLVEMPGPLLVIQTPEPGALVYEGAPEIISWVSVLKDHLLKIELSTDNGINWELVADSVSNTGSYTWVPQAAYSPWCILRLTSISDETITSKTELPFEIAASTQLIFNGYFVLNDSGWTLGFHEESYAFGEITEDGYYKIQIDTAGSEESDIQLIQSRISLQSQITYQLSFTAYSDSNRTISVELSGNDGSTESFIDSSLMEIKLTSSPGKYKTNFTMGAEGCTDAQLVFNLGLDDKDVYIDDVSIVRQIYAPYVLPFLRKAKRLRMSSGTILTLTNKDDPASFSNINNLMGRSLRKTSATAGHSGKSRLSPGLYISSKKKTNE